MLLHKLSSGERQRQRDCRLTASEMMTIIIHFHQSQYRHFKAYYLLYVCKHLKAAFPNLVSYTRFVALMPSVLLSLCVYLNTRKGQVTKLAFIDATTLVVCHNRIYNHKVFNKLARRGKTSMGWFYAFKLHLIVNDQGELLAFQVTPGNVDDRTPVPQLTKRLTGKLFGDRGYISQKLFETLLEENLQLITTLRKNMKNKLFSLFDKLVLRKRSIIEIINDQLKNISQIEHTRHRSVSNFMINLVAGLIAYTHQPTKPSLKIEQNQLKLLTSQA